MSEIDLDVFAFNLGTAWIPQCQEIYNRLWGITENREHFQKNLDFVLNTRRIEGEKPGETFSRLTGMSEVYYEQIMRGILICLHACRITTKLGMKLTKSLTTDLSQDELFCKRLNHTLKSA